MRQQNRLSAGQCDCQVTVVHDLAEIILSSSEFQETNEKEAVHS